MPLAAAIVALSLAAEPPSPTPVAESLSGRAGVTGDVRVHRQMRTAQADPLTPRDVSVWLPPGYHDAANADRRYPVLYMHDGQNAFDPATAFLGREWHADEIAQRLIVEGALAPIIIVGVWNTPDRVADYTPDEDPDGARTDGKPQGRGGRAERYLRWIVEELKPFVDANYRTRPGREHTATLGSSLGGIVSLAAGERSPEVFGCVAAVSPSLWWNGGSVIERWRARTPSLCRLWVDMGDRERAGLTEALGRFEHAVRPALQDRLHAEVVPGARHDEPSWSARLGRILRFLFAESDWRQVPPPEPVPPVQEAPVAVPSTDAKGASGAPRAPHPPPA